MKPAALGNPNIFALNKILENFEGPLSSSHIKKHLNSAIINAKLIRMNIQYLAYTGPTGNRPLLIVTLFQMNFVVKFFLLH